MAYKSKILPAFLIVLALTVFSSRGFAQATDANLVGSILDPSSGGVPNATVDLENMATGVKYSTVADSRGQYRFNNAPVGRYSITATAPGFTSSSLRNVDLQLNKTATANLTLQLGTVATTVDVTDAGVLIDTTTAQITSTYQDRAKPSTRRPRRFRWAC